MAAQLEKNLALAMTGVAVVYSQFPLGGLNRADVLASMELTFYLFQLNLFQLFRDATASEDFETIDAIFDSNLLKGAFCQEMAVFALIKLHCIADETPVELVILENHHMLVIGRCPDSDPLDYTTWGCDAVFCDPWARKFYEISKFELEREKGEKIIIIQSIDPRTGELLNVEPEYLKGQPRIAT